MAVTPQEPPKWLRLQDVRVDLKRLFLKLGEAAAKAGVAAATGKWATGAGGIITSVFGAAEAVSHDTPPETLAWLLLRRSLTRALAELVAESLSDRPPPAGGDKQHLSTRIGLETDRAVTEQSLRIDLDFFENPTALPLLPAVERIFADWLHRFCDLPEADAASIAGRLRSYFAVALHDEWRSDEATYKPLLQSLNGPFAKAVQWEQEWERYRLSLAKEFARPVFEERFPVSAVYVPLRAAYLETLPPKPDAKGGPALARAKFAAAEERRARTVVVDLEAAILQWLRTADPSDTLRLIRGGPGSGKSTFSKKLAADLAGQRAMRVLFFPLQHFRIGGKLLDAIGEALGEHGAAAFTDNPLEQPQFATADRPLLLVFDGLDELAQPGRAADEQTRVFLGDLRSFLDRWNQNQCRVFGLVTGRTAVVQASRDVLKLSERQELEVLPFLVTDAAADARKAAGNPFHDPVGHLAADQRELWWRNYAACKAGEPAEMPASLRSAEVADLSAEPLLLYLIVLSGFHRRPEQEEQVNRNTIYADLFRGVAERRHAGGQPLAARAELREDFDEVMETVATAAWYGDGRTATVGEIRHWCPAHLKAAVESFLGSEAGVARLIAAFYFQRTEPGARRRDAIEFTHKSFGEYLTARRLVRAVAEIAQELGKGGRRYGEAQALEEWFDLTHYTAMDLDLLRFVRDEVRLHHEQAADWQGPLCRLLSRSIRDGMPVKLSDDVTFRWGERRARNAEEALLALLNACARVTGQVSKPAWSEPTDAGDLIHRLRLQPSESRLSPLVLNCLSQTDFRLSILLRQDLAEADLGGSDLGGAVLSDANLRGANLQDADLQAADLEDANLRGANLQDADLHVAALQDADLRSANLQAANLQGAHLHGANLYGANLQDADLHEAILRAASLRGANLQDADLHVAVLEGADLRSANLQGANLDRANIAAANLTDAKLEGA